MAASMPLVFGSLLAGAVILDYGVKNAKGAFSGAQGSTGTTAPGTGSGAPTGAAGSVTEADLQRVGAKHGWSGAQLADWMNVIQKESSGNPHAVNPSSGAAGLAQFINGWGEYKTYGGNDSTVIGQLTAMANYIAQRYGTPAAAWQHEQANNWY